MAEIDTHWREFVHSLEGLDARMHGPQDLEQVLLGIHLLLHDAIKHAQKQGPQLSAQVRSCMRRDVFLVTMKNLKSKLVKHALCSDLSPHPQFELPAPCQIGMW